MLPSLDSLAKTVDTAATLVASLINLMERGTSPWRRTWDGPLSGHHVNLRSGRPYRGANPVLLTLGMHLRASRLPYWCGWSEARALGLAPRRGSKAVHVLQPMVHGSSDDDATDRGWVSYRPMAVFNAVDLVGEALPALLEARRADDRTQRRPEPARLATAEAVLQRWPVPMCLGGSQACYNPQADRIMLPERCAFHSAAAFYATWAHEIIHSTGHVTRLNRDLAGCYGSPSYAREELVAELGSVLLGDRLEIGSDLANHAAYLASWVALLNDSPRLLLQVLSDVRRAVDLIAPEVPLTAESETTDVKQTPAGVGSSRSEAKQAGDWI